MSLSFGLNICLNFKLLNRLMLICNSLEAQGYLTVHDLYFSSLRTLSPSFVNDINMQNKIYGNIQRFSWIPVSLSDPIHKTLTLRLLSTENTKHFILAEVSFYSTMIVLLFRAHPKMRIFLCHCFCLPFSASVWAESFMNMKLVQA